jgi:hypothetical protein
MEGETDRVLARLERIEALRSRAGEAPPGLLLDELRALVAEADRWAALDGDARARAAVERLRSEAEGMG